MTFCLETLQIKATTANGIFMELTGKDYTIPNAYYVSDRYRVWYVPFNLENRRVLIEV